MTRHPAPADGELIAFLRESLKIEGIHREPSDAEIAATIAFLDLAAPHVEDVVTLVKVYQPDAVLRDQPHLNVYVGSHVPPQGGATVVTELRMLLEDLPGGFPWRTHVAYEILHPFTDGNGRSGRTIWAWQMVRRQRGLPLGFLHQFYYQTLAARSP